MKYAAYRLKGLLSTQTCSCRLMLFTIKSARNNAFYNAIECIALTNIMFSFKT